MNTDRLQQAITNLVTSETPAAALEGLRVALTLGKVTPAISINSILRLLQPERISPPILAELLGAWQENSEMTPAALALSIGTALAVRRSTADAAPKLTLAWTGDQQPVGSNVRPTLSVILEMLDHAAARILIVGYDLTEASEKVVQALSRARARGCTITIALHNNGHNHQVLTQLWPGAATDKGIKVFQWRGRPGDAMAKLHAKMVAVDEDDLLITSANLTYGGLERNIEMGVRIRGDVAWQAIHHFALLVQDGVLIPYQT